MAGAAEVGAGMTRLVAGVLAATAVCAAVGTTVLAQRNGFGPRRVSIENQPYDGRFTFVRMSYPTGMSFGRRGDTPWAHDYPDGERNFLKIFTAVTNVHANLDGTNVLTFDDPEMFKFPVIYLVEPGFWDMSDEQVTMLRQYLRKGGFLIIDDFPWWGWQQFELQMRRVFPDLQWLDLDVSHPVFHSFFDIETLDIVPAYPALGERPIFRALFEDNDQTGRMYAIANFQNDLSEFWEFSDQGYYAIGETNEAYKMGVNQFMYGLIR
jgi:hypothetical protein